MVKTLRSSAKFTGQYSASFDDDEFEAGIRYVALILTELLGYLLSQTQIAPDFHALILDLRVMISVWTEIGRRVLGIFDWFDAMGQAWRELTYPLKPRWGYAPG